MGLDIGYYQAIALKKAGGFDEELADQEGVRLFYNDKSFKPRFDGLTEGYYDFSGEAGHFRVGSYSYYNHWRSELAQMVGVQCEDAWNGGYDGPFAELINFSDCEGAIGPKTSAKLANDFGEWAERATELDEDFQETYRNFWNAFQVAAGNGAVKFA